jgi:hypothetical protein
MGQQQSGLQNAMAFIQNQKATGMVNPMSASSMFVSPQQRMAIRERENAAQFNRDLMAAQVRAQPDPMMAAIGSSLSSSGGMMMGGGMGAAIGALGGAVLGGVGEMGSRMGQGDSFGKALGKTFGRLPTSNEVSQIMTGAQGAVIGNKLASGKQALVSAAMANQPTQAAAPQMAPQSNDMVPNALSGAGNPLSAPVNKSADFGSWGDTGTSATIGQPRMQLPPLTTGTDIDTQFAAEMQAEDALLESLPGGSFHSGLPPEIDRQLTGHSYTVNGKTVDLTTEFEKAFEVYDQMPELTEKLQTIAEQLQRQGYQVQGAMARPAPSSSLNPMSISNAVSGIKL